MYALASLVALPLLRGRRGTICTAKGLDVRPPASVVNWLLQGRTGEIHQVVLAQTEHIEEWSVLWHVPVDAAAKDSVTAYFDRLADSPRQS